MRDFVLGLAKTVVEGAVTKAQSAIEEEKHLLQSVQRDLGFISGEFQMMQSFLNVTNVEHVRNEVVRTWVRQVRDLAYDVEDCIEFVVHLDTKPAWWRRLLPPCMAAALPLDEAVAEIKQLKARVEDVSQRNTRYKLIDDSGSKTAVPQLQTAAAGATTFDILKEVTETARRQRDLRDITELITNEDGGLQVISVWVTGDDLDTTSIIRKAYDDLEICQNFTRRGWAKLSHPFNPHEFLRGLLTQFCRNSCKEQRAIVDVDVLTRMETVAATPGELIKEFAKQVNEQRYLVVLEDVSTMAEWDAISMYLPDRMNRSRIVVSTPQFQIASLCTGHPYRVSELREISADHSVCVFFKEGSHRSLVEKALYRGISCVMSVWGIAGVGKSALVKCLYDVHGLYSYNCGWVNVSHPFNLREFSRSLLLNLLSEYVLDEEHPDNFGIDPIQECRELLLLERTCLVVTDGLQSTEEWDLIKAALLVAGSSLIIVIVVTNEANVAIHCADQQDSVLNVKGLEADMALDLFKKKERPLL